LNLDAEREQMTGQVIQRPIHVIQALTLPELALCLAESLKRLMALDSASLQKTITEIRHLLPPNINATLGEGGFHVSVIPHRSYENPMALPNILQTSDLDRTRPPSLERSEDPDTPDGCPGTPTDFESYVEVMSIYPEENIWDNFDAVDWPSWMNNDVLIRYD
jgi:hypothetical protein